MKIYSWNIAGINPSLKRGNLDFLLNSNIDIICFQETKVQKNKLNIENKFKEEFPFQYWSYNDGSSQRLGFNGTAIWSKFAPINELQPPEFDKEGRLTVLEFKEFYLINVYTPNSQYKDSERSLFRTNIWDPKFREYFIKLQRFKSVIICGDFNVAYIDIDLYDPKKYKNKVAGFLDCERDNFTKHLENELIDSFRIFNPDEENYTYWNQRVPTMRIKNKGWRIDYILINKNLIKNIINSSIHPDIFGSDHCPISIDINFTPLNNSNAD